MTGTGVVVVRRSHSLGNRHTNFALKVPLGEFWVDVDVPRFLGNASELHRLPFIIGVQISI